MLFLNVPVDREKVSLPRGIRRKREAVIRFHKYNKDAEPSSWYRAKLMYYYPWYHEETDLLGGYDTYEQHYQHVQAIAHTNEQKYCSDVMRLRTLT